MRQNYKKNQNNNRQRINEAIRATEILVIDSSGNTTSCSVQEGIQQARDMGLDLVEVSPNANPPVCKILDYGKYKYEQNKNRKNTTKKTQTLKEIRMQPKISDHDLDFKTKHIQDFLLEGHKVKVTVRFKGRELAHTELGEELLLSILEKLTCSHSVDKRPTMEGRNMSMMLSPNNKSKKKTDSSNKEQSPSAESPTNGATEVKKVEQTTETENLQTHTE